MNFKSKVSESLKKAYPFRAELHAHTSPVSPCGDFPPETVLKVFKDSGYDAIAITNHFYRVNDKTPEEYTEWYKKDVYKTMEIADKTGIKLYVGAELRFKNQNDNDYLLYGFDPEQIGTMYDLMQGTLEDFVREFKTDDMLLIQAHPFRKGMELNGIECLDAIEGFNMHPNHNSRVALAVKYGNENGKIITIGTDYHHENHHNLCATRMPYLPENTSELVKLIKSGDFIGEVGDKLIL